MGQYWLLYVNSNSATACLAHPTQALAGRLNLDRRETGSGIGGKLGECFWFMGDSLYNSLKIPSTPIPLPK